MTTIDRLFAHARATLLKNTGTLMLILVSAIVAWLIFYPQLGASLWIADDHQILSTVDKAGTGFAGFWNVVTHPDDYPLAGGSRIRPVFWPLRMSEIFAWYDNAGLWHFARYVYLTAFIALVASAIYRHASLSLAVLVVPLLASLESISGLWWRLGAAEAYGAVGIGLLVWGVAVLLKREFLSERPSSLDLTLLNLGILLSVGCKENFLGFAVFLLLTPIMLVRYRTLKLVPLIFWAAAVAVTVLMTNHLLEIFATREAGGSILVGLISEIWSGLVGTIQYLWWALILSVLALLICFILPRTRLASPRSLAALIFVITVAGLVLAVISQPTFHGGNWPNADPRSRYNFVGWISPVLLGLLSASLLYAALAQAFSFRFRSSSADVVVAAILGVASIVLYSFYHPPVYEQAAQIKRTTGNTDKSLGEVQAKVEDQDLAFLTIEVQSSRDYEAAISTLIHLRHRGVEVPAFVRVIPAEDPYGATALLNALRNFSAKGERGFTPIGQMPALGSNCLSIYFYSVPTHENKCEAYRFLY